MVVYGWPCECQPNRMNDCEILLEHTNLLERVGCIILSGRCQLYNLEPSESHCVLLRTYKTPAMPAPVVKNVVFVRSALRYCCASFLCLGQPAWSGNASMGERISSVIILMFDTRILMPTCVKNNSRLNRSNHLQRPMHDQMEQWAPQNWCSHAPSIDATCEPLHA